MFILLSVSNNIYIDTDEGENLPASPAALARPSISFCTECFMIRPLTNELSINGQAQVRAPFLVVNGGTVPTNHPPNAVTAAFDPAAPGTNDAVFCRLTVPLLEDPDFQLLGMPRVLPRKEQSSGLTARRLRESASPKPKCWHEMLAETTYRGMVRKPCLGPVACSWAI